MPTLPLPMPLPEHPLRHHINAVSRTVDGRVIDDIKVSRGEENTFVWCVFLAVVRLALDGAEAYPFNPELFPAAPEKALA